ncbi:hypothetical protein ACWEQC_31420 [Streptomyces shenzhenensis]
MRHTHLHLGEPPLVASVGAGEHGVASPADVFRLPGLGQPHLYGYGAGLGVDGTPHLVRPGRVRLVPSGATVATAGGAAPSSSARGCASPSRAPRTAFPSSRTPDLNVRCAEPCWGKRWPPYCGRRGQPGRDLDPPSRTANPASAAEHPGLHPAVSAAVARIEAGPAGPLTALSVSRTTS